jgi:hypothetical protein
MHLAFFVADRDIFTRTEGMRTEAVAAFIVVLGSLIVIKDPTSVLGAARPMHEEAVFIILAFRKPPHAAVIAMLFP